MKSLFSVAKEMQQLSGKSILWLSAGKDAAASLLLCQKYIPGRFIPVHMYFCPGLEFRERYLCYLEDRFSVKIERIPHRDISSMVGGPIIKQAEQEKQEADRLGCRWHIYGYRMQESLMRRGLIRQNGFIDKKNSRIYPIAEWNHNDVIQYLKRERLPLAVEYQLGFRDINSFKGEAALFIRNNFPDDWERILRYYPNAEAEIVRVLNGKN